MYEAAEVRRCINAGQSDVVPRAPVILAAHVDVDKWKRHITKWTANILHILTALLCSTGLLESPGMSHGESITIAEVMEQMRAQMGVI